MTLGDPYGVSVPDRVWKSSLLEDISPFTLGSPMFILLVGIIAIGTLSDTGRLKLIEEVPVFGGIALLSLILAYRALSAKVILGHDSITVVRTLRTVHLPYEECSSVVVVPGLFKWHATCLAIQTSQGRTVRTGLHSGITTAGLALSCSTWFRQAKEELSTELKIRKTLHQST